MCLRNTPKERYKTMAEVKFYKLEEVEQILQLTRRTLYNYIKSGKLKAVKVGRDWRVSAKAIQELSENGTEE